MIRILSGLVELPYRCLSAVGIPLMLALLLPSEKARLMDPLVRTSAQHQGRLLPDTAARQVEACGIKCFAEVQPFCVCMEHIDGSIVRHDLLDIGKSIEQEIKKGIAGKIVVLNLTGSAFVIHIIRRVCNDQIGFSALHQYFVGFGLCRITNYQTVSAQGPNITHFGDTRLF